MQQIPSQCANCGTFARRSLYHEEEYRSSALLERLRTSNFSATDKEITHIRHDVLPTVSDDLSSIDSQLATLQRAITSLEAERERLMNVQKKYNNLISSQRAVPLEIWSTIFLYTLSGDSDFNAFDASGSMWRLSHVCQKWRNIALSLCSFWSTLVLHFPKAAQSKKDVMRLEAVIRRSHHGLLNISLCDVPSPSTSNPSIIKRMIDIVLAESYRWRKLHVMDWRGALTMLYVSLPNQLPCLESIRLHHVSHELEKNPLVASFKGCPRLRKLALDGSPPVVECPWGQITKLDLSGVDYEGSEEDRRACMRMIGLCSSLETLSVPYWYLEEREDESPYTPTTCLNVRKLSAVSMRVVDALTLPRLRELSLHPELAMRDNNALHSVEQLLIRSSSLTTLTSLSLASVPLAASPGGTLHSLLFQTNCLSSLDLSVSVQQFDDETDASDQEQIVTIVRSLEIVPKKRVTFLPLLSSLALRINNHLEEENLPYFGPIGRFASTLKARWRGDGMIGLARLRSCHFAVQADYLYEHDVYRNGGFVTHFFDKAERSSFDALVDEGMDLTIRITSNLIQSTGDNGVIFAVP